MVKATVSKLPNSRIEIKGVLEAADFGPYIEKTKSAFAKNTELPGFRKGMAPEKMVAEHVGEAKILERAAESALQEVWPGILKENNIDAIGPAEFHILKLAAGNDLEWKAIVSTIPAVSLPDYKAVAHSENGNLTETENDISDKEVDDTLAFIQKSRAKDGKQPELNDEFARSLGKYESLDALKKNIRDGIKAERAQKARDAHKMKIAGAIAEKSSIEIPDLMIASEKEKMAHELKTSVSQMGLEWQKYLEHIKKSEDELKAGWDKDAEKRVRIALVLREIAKKENLRPTDEEVQRTADELIERSGENSLDRARVRDYAYGILRNEKVFNFLESC